MSLILCGQCARHVREPGVCPFCGAPIGAQPDSSAPLANRRSRTALFLGAAAIGVACSSTAPQPMYGAVILDSGSDAKDDQSAQPAYGAVIPDSGADADSGPAPAYGGPPLDAGTD
jgi:hypothetical protein